MTQTSLWQAQQSSTDYVELCNALYERELCVLSQIEINSTAQLQARIKSLPYYIKRTAHQLIQANTHNSLMLDTQNASWSAKQSGIMPLVGQDNEKMVQWYNSFTLSLGLVVPLRVKHHIVLDSIDRIDEKQQRFRTNVHGWFSLKTLGNVSETQSKAVQLLNINKKVMIAACAGHTWHSLQVSHKSATNKSHPTALTLRELLLSCQINWKNFKIPLLNSE